MKRIGKRPGRRFLALVLVISMVIGLNPQWGGFRKVQAAESTEYTELTFCDWGINDGAITGGKSGTTTLIDTIAGTAFTGIVHFTGTGEMIRLGGVDNEWYGMDIQYIEPSYSGIQIRLLNNSGSAFSGGTIIKDTEIGTIKNNDVKLRLTFDVDGTSVLVGISVNDKFMRTCTFENASDCLGKKFVINGSANGFAVKSAIDYAKLTFSDLSMEEKTYVSEGEIGKLPSGISSLNGVSIGGKVTFPETTQNSYIQIGHTSQDELETSGIRIFRSEDSGKIYFWDKTGAGVHQPIVCPSDDAFGNKELEVWVAFRFIGDDIHVSASVTTDVRMYSLDYTIAGKADTFGTGVFVNSHSVSKQPITIASADMTGKTISFEDYGLSGTTVSNNAETQVKAYDALTMSGLAFEDDVTFKAGSPWLYMATKNTNGWHGIRVYQNDSYLGFKNCCDGKDHGDILTINHADCGITDKTASIHLRVAFSYVRANAMLMRVTVNESYSRTVYVSGITKELGTGIFAYAPADASILLGEEPTGLDSYKRITPMKFGLEDSTVAAGESNNHKAGTYTGSTLDKTYLDADVTFKSGNDLGDSVRFASFNGWSGIKLAMKGETDPRLCVIHATDSGQSYSFAASELGIAFGQKFNVKIGLRLSDIDTTNKTQTVSVILYVNDKSVSDSLMQFTSVPLDDNGKANMLSIYGEKGTVSIATPYDEVSLKDAGIADKCYIAETVTGSYSAKTMDGMALTAKLTFAEGSATGSNYLKIGNEFMVGYDYNGGTTGVLFWDCNTSSSNKANHTRFITGSGKMTEIAQKAVVWRLTFDYTNNDTDVRVGFYLDGVYIGAAVFEGAAATFTNAICLTSSDKPIVAGDAYTDLTLWDWGIENGSISTAASSLVRSNSELTGYDKSIFRANLKFVSDDSGNVSLRIGGWMADTDYSWYGIHIYVANDKVIYAQNMFVGTTGNNSLEKITELSENVSAASVKLSLQFDYVGDDICVAYYVNDVYQKKITYPGAAKLIGNYLILQTADGTEFVYSSCGEREKIEKKTASYNLSDGAYLVSGSIVTVKKGDTVVADEAGDTISAPGDYEIERIDGGKVYTQTVILYQMGDVNCDGKQADATDLQTLQTLLDGKESLSLDSAAMHAADLNNDEVVDKHDLRLMKEITDGRTTLQAVLDQYHVSALSYDYLGGDEVMPIAGYYGPYRRNAGEVSYDYLSDEIFQDIKDVGVNLVTYAFNHFGESDDGLDALAQAEKYGLGYYVNDWVLNHELEGTSETEIVKNPTPLTTKEAAEQISKYSYFDSYLGTHVADEPFPELKWTSAVTDYGKMEYRELQYVDDVASKMNSFSNSIGFLNTFPEDSTVFSFSEETYATYLENVIATGAKVLSVDDYPFADKAGDDVTNAQGYFKTLWQVRNTAQDAGIPFWTYVQGGGDFDEKGNAVDTGRLPSEEETYWNVNTCLAFGSKGIEWFPLIQPNDFAETNNGYDYDRNGLIGADKSKTTYYEWAKKANRQIATVDEVLMKAKSTGVMATDGYAKKVVGEKADVSFLNSQNTMLANTNPIVSSDTTYGALVGCFDYKDTEAFYVVNYSTESGSKQQITLNFKARNTYRLLYDGTEKNGVGTSVTMTIPSGEAVLVVLGLTEGDTNGDGISDVRDLVRSKRVEQNMTGVTYAKGFDYDKDASEIREYIARKDSITLVSPMGDVYPYAKEVREYLEAGSGASVTAYHASMNTQARSVEIAWKGYFDDVTGYTVSYATKSDYSDAVTTETDAETTKILVSNLYKDTTYYVRVTAKTASGNQAQDFTFHTTDVGPRFMQVDGIYNVRDLGGYETANGKTTLQGLIYRGGSLTPTKDFADVQLSDAGKVYMSETMKIKTEIELRGSTEAPGTTSQIPGATLKRCEVNGYGDGLTQNQNGYKEVFVTLADSNNYPVYFHCTGGADRTGTVAFLLNALLGVDETALIQDYELTSFSVYGIRDSQEGTYKSYYDSLRATLNNYDGDTLAEKTENYLLGIGVTKTQIDQIKSIMYGDKN